MRYPEEFCKKVIEQAKNQGIKPTARLFRIAPNTIRNWIKLSKGENPEDSLYHRPRNRIKPEIETYVISLKEKSPTITFRVIQSVLKKERNIMLSLEGIRGILRRFGMTGDCYYPLRNQGTPEIERGIKFAESLISMSRIEEAAKILNSLPALPDFTILEKIPTQMLTTRRQVEQLGAIVDKLPKKELLERAKELRKKCEEEKRLYTAIFAAAIEVNALNFRGFPRKVELILKKYTRFLDNLPPPMKYLFLSECYISFIRKPSLFPQEAFRNFLRNFENFCKNMPPGDHRIMWYYYLSGAFHISGNINKALYWMEKLLCENLKKDEKKYLTQYFALLGLKGDYEKLMEFDFDAIIKNQPISGLLRLSLVKANALLAMGNLKDSLYIVLNHFYDAQKEHLVSYMQRFSFFLACYYGSLNQVNKVKQYLKKAYYYSRHFEHLRKFYEMFLQPGLGEYPGNSADVEIQLAYLYRRACKTLKRRDYLRAYNFAKRRGLMGLFHRIVLLRPDIVVKFIKERKQTYLPEKFLSLPVFKEATPGWRIFLLRNKESVFYGDKKISIAASSKDFHLLVYLFLNRKKNINRDTLLELFYKNTTAPDKCLIKAFSRIRAKLGLPKGVLTLRKTLGVFFNVEARMDLEEFEERFKIGKIFERAGETNRAIVEYQECFKLYKKSPFDWMGYYYNFAEDRRALVRSMYQEICMKLLVWAKEKGDYKWVNRIRMKLKIEGLMSQEGQKGDATNF